MAGISAVGMAKFTANAAEPNELEAIARRFVDDVLTGQSFELIDSMASPEFVSDNPEDAPGRDAFKTRIERKLDVDTHLIDNITYTTESMISSETTVIVRGYVKGASRSGKNVNSLYFLQLDFADNLIIGCWLLRDEGALLGI